jgi:hypothetical protein
MNTLWLYCIIAILVLVVAVLLLRPGSEGPPAEPEEYAQGLWDSPGWNLAERIFDSSDYLWLRNELRFPHLAKVLAHSRRQLALKWLRGLRRSFDELARTPESNTPDAAPLDAPSSWELLRLTLRFHLILSYAVLVVRLFGPYHRLVPSYGWMRSPSPQAEHLGPANSTRGR